MASDVFAGEHGEGNAMKTGQAQEFSMDDVLESIRRIISDGETPADGDLGAHGDPAISRGFLEGFEQAARTVSLADPEDVARQVTRPAMAAPAAAAPHPVLDRAVAAARAAATPRPVERAPQTVRPAPVLRGTTESPRAEMAPRPELAPRIEAPVQAPVVATVPPPPAADRLLSRAAESAVESAFGSLGQAMSARHTQPQTLEDLVKDLMRPMVSAWLDRNLPTLVERLVQAEIQRLSRRG